MEDECVSMSETNSEATLDDVYRLIARQPYVQTLQTPHKKLIALLGLIEEANEVAEQLFNNLDIFATANYAHKTVEELQSTIEVSLSIGKELGLYKKRLLQEDLAIDVQLKNNEWLDSSLVIEECFDVIYYWLLVLLAEDIDLTHLFKIGINKVYRRDSKLSVET